MPRLGCVRWCSGITLVIVLDRFRKQLVVETTGGQGGHVGLGPAAVLAEMPIGLLQARSAIGPAAGCRSTPASARHDIARCPAGSHQRQQDGDRLAVPLPLVQVLDELRLGRLVQQVLPVSKREHFDGAVVAAEVVKEILGDVGDRGPQPFRRDTFSAVRRKSSSFSAQYRGLLRW